MSKTCCGQYWHQKRNWIGKKIDSELQVRQTPELKVFRTVAARSREGWADDYQRTVKSIAEFGELRAISRVVQASVQESEISVQAS